MAIHSLSQTPAQSTESTCALYDNKVEQTLVIAFGKDQPFQQSQYAKAFGPEDLLFCASTTINGFQTIPSIQFHSQGLGQSMVRHSIMLTPEIHHPDQSPTVRFEPGSHF